MTITHKDLVRALAKPGLAIMASMTSTKMHLLHMAVGVSGEVAEFMQAARNLDRENALEELGDTEFYMEGIYDTLELPRQMCADMQVYDPISFSAAAGDLLDVVKKITIYNKAPDAGTLQRAMDTMERELCAARSFFDITREECISHNIAKLTKRYSEGRYSDAAAQRRADKE